MLVGEAVSWAGGFTVDLDVPYKVTAGDRYVIEWDVFDDIDPQVFLRAATSDDLESRVMTAIASGIITQVRIEVR